MARQKAKAGHLFAAILLSYIGRGVPGSTHQHCDEPPRDTTVLLMKRSGPQVTLIEYNGTTGRPTGLRTIVKRHAAALSGFVVDSQQQEAYFFSAPPRIELHSFALTEHNILALQSKEGLVLQDEANNSIQNVWNVVPWESRGGLIALAPSSPFSTSAPFNSSVLVIDTNTGRVTVRTQLAGIPIMNIFALDSQGGRYFFTLARSTGSALVVYYIETGSYTSLDLGNDAEGLVGLHFDRIGCRLVAIKARESCVLDLFTVAFSGGCRDCRANLTHLTTIGLNVEDACSPHYFVGHTHLLHLEKSLRMLSIDPRSGKPVVHNIEDKSHVSIDSQDHDIVGVAIRTRRKPAVTALRPGHIGIWGHSRVTIIGFDFGLRDPAPLVSVGNTMATSSEWISDSAISFLAPRIVTMSDNSRICEPWHKSDGFIYRTSWGELTGAVSRKERRFISICHPSHQDGSVCAFANTPREMRCEELSVGFVCARWDTGSSETVSLDVQLGINGVWLSSNTSTDVVSTWHSVTPTTGSVDGGHFVTIVGGPFFKDQGDFSCRFGGQNRGVATYFNESMVLCEVPSWPFLPDMTRIELLVGHSVIPSDSVIRFRYAPGAPAQLVLLPSTTKVKAMSTAKLEVELRDRFDNRVLEKITNITLKVVPVALVQQNSIPSILVLKQGTVAGKASFGFALERAGTYQMMFANEECNNENAQLSGKCLESNATLEVLVGIEIKSLTVSASRHALAGMPVFPCPEVRVLNSEHIIANVSVLVTARLAEPAPDFAFNVSTVVTSGGLARFNDMIIRPQGAHTIIFSLTGEHGQIEIRHNISVLFSAPKALFNSGSRPINTHVSMLPITPAPSLWVLDFGGNRIRERYWTQDQNGTLEVHYLNVSIWASLSREEVVPSAALALQGSLFGAVQVLLRGQGVSHAQTCSGLGSTGLPISSGISGSCCAAGWQGSNCALPTNGKLCGGGDVCAAQLGFWNASMQKCTCIDRSSLQYSVTQGGGESADFNELLIDREGKYIVTFASEGLSPAQSLLFAVVPGNASRLYVVSNPLWAAAGAGFSNPIIVALKDAGQNIVTGPYVGGAFNVTVQLVDAPAHATLTGSLVRTIYGGFANFEDLTIDRPTSGHKCQLMFLALTAGGCHREQLTVCNKSNIIPAYTSSFHVEEGPPHMLRISQEPGGASGGTPFRIQPKVQVLDPASNVVSRAQGTVKTYLQGSEMLLGNLEAQVLDGNAEFTDLTINQSGIYHIFFTVHLNPVNMSSVGIYEHKWYAASNLTALSQDFEVLAGRAVRMVIFRQPGNAYGGEIVPQPIIHFVDKGNNRVAGNRIVVHVVARIQQDSLILNSSLKTYTSDTGSIEFTDIEILQPGQRFQLVFTIIETASEHWSGRDPIILTDTLGMRSGQLTNLSVRIHPDSVVSGWPFSRHIMVVLVDKAGNLVPKSDVLIRVSLDTTFVNTSSSAFDSSMREDDYKLCQDVEVASVEGKLLVPTVEGIALFTNLRVGKAGSGFRLMFESELLNGAASQIFGVTLGEIAVSLHVVCSPGVQVAGVAFKQQPILDVVDRGGNRMHAQMPQDITAILVFDFCDSILQADMLRGLRGDVANILSGAECGSKSYQVNWMSGQTKASLHGDLASFRNLAIDVAGKGFVLQFSSPGLNAAKTHPFEVIAGEAVALYMENSSVQPVPGEPVSITILSRDRGGNMESRNMSQTFNVTANLHQVKTIARNAACQGTRSCEAQLDLSVPTSSRLLSAKVSINISCTDFDSHFEHITSIKAGSYSFDPTMDYLPGPFQGCFRNCSKSVFVMDQIDIVRPVCLDGGRSYQAVCHDVPVLTDLDWTRYSKWDMILAMYDYDMTSVPFHIHVSTDVNFHPCNSFVLDATIEVILTYTVPDVEQGLLGRKNVVSENGLAVFDSLVMTDIEKDNVLSFTSQSSQLLPAYSRVFQLTHGPVRQLVVLVHPLFGTGNVTLQPNPVIMLADAAGNRVLSTESEKWVVAQLIVHGGVRPLTATLQGRTRVAVKHGLADFTDLYVGRKSDAWNYSILFSLDDQTMTPTCNSSLSVCSNPFPVEPGPACCMMIVVNPKMSKAGDIFPDQPTLKAYDWGGNEVALNDAVVAAKIGVNGGITGQLMGSPTIFENGLARFSDLRIDKVGAGYNLIFSSPRMFSVTSFSFDVTVGDAKNLKVMRQVTGARLNKMFTTQPSVAAVDAGGNIVKSWQGNVNVAIYKQGSKSHPLMPIQGRASLYGNTTGFMYQGVSYFWNLRLNCTGVHFVLIFSAFGMESATSNSFDVFGQVATQLIILESPTVFTTTLPNSDIVVAAVDEEGNIDGFSTRSFEFDIIQPSSNATLQIMEPPELFFLKGILTVIGLKLRGKAVGARWRISEENLPSVDSDAFDTIDAFTGWWTLNGRHSEKRLFLTRDVMTRKVQAASFDGVCRNFSSKYQSLLENKNGCTETSIASTDLRKPLGYHLESCKEGTLTCVQASQVNAGVGVDISWVRDILHAEIQDYSINQAQHFVLFANSKNSSTNDEYATVYRWAGQKLEYYQRLATKGAYDIEHFILEGSHYIAVINHFDHGGAGFGVDSMLYRYAWSNSEERNIFKPVQAISTDGGTACKHFEIRGQHFLAVANYFNGSHAAIKSTIYRIQRSDPDTNVPTLSLFQSIPTNGARDVVFISDNLNHLIAFANRYDNNVHVMRWSDTSQRFISVNGIPCSQAVDLEAFSSNDRLYVICTSLAPRYSTNGSAVFGYDSTNGKFVRTQSLPTHAAQFVSLFSSGAEIFLTVADAGLNSTETFYPPTIDVLVWNGSLFMPYLILATDRGHANALIEVPCLSTSADGSACADRTMEKLVLVAHDERGRGELKTFHLATVTGTRMATHMKMMPVTFNNTQVNSSLPIFSGQLMNLDGKADFRSIWASGSYGIEQLQDIVADSLMWSDPVLGMLDAPISAPAYGKDILVINASATIAFSQVFVIAAGQVSIRMSNTYLNSVSMATSSKFEVAAGDAASLRIYSTWPLQLMSGESLSAIVIVCDKFGNHQPDQPATITAFPNDTSSLTLFNTSVATLDGVAHFALSVIGNTMDAIVGFRAEPPLELSNAFTPKLVVKSAPKIHEFEHSKILTSSAAVSIGDEKILLFGGRNGTKASNAFLVADVSEIPYQISRPTFFGSVPSARYGHVAVGGLYQNSNRAVLVLGGTDGRTVFDDVHSFDLETNTWTDLPLTIDGRFEFRAQHAQIKDGTEATKLKSVVILLGGKNGLKETAKGMVIVRILTNGVKVEEVEEEDISENPFTTDVFGCCSFMFSWHGNVGYVFGLDSAGFGALYVLNVNYIGAYMAGWTYEEALNVGPITPPKSALFSSSWDLGQQLYFAAIQSGDETPALYSLDVSGPAPKWIGMYLDDFALLGNRTYSVASLATGKAMLISNEEDVLHCSALVISVVKAEKLIVTSEAPAQALSGKPLDPEPVLHIVDAKGNRARDQSGYADVTVSAYDSDTMKAIKLKGQEVMQSVDGVVTFKHLAIINTAERVMLKFTSTSLLPVMWGPIQVLTGPGSSVVFAVQPYGAQPGQAFAIQPQVKMIDAAGNEVTNDSTTVIALVLETYLVGTNTRIVDISQDLTGTTWSVVHNGKVAFNDIGLEPTIPINNTFRLSIVAAGMVGSVSNDFRLALPSDTDLHLKVNWTTKNAGVCRGWSILTDIPLGCHFHSKVAASSHELLAGTPLIHDPHLIIMVKSTLARYITSAEFMLSLLHDDGDSSSSSSMLTMHASAVGGEVYFKDFQVNVTGRYKLKITSHGFPEVISGFFHVMPGIPSEIHCNQLASSPAGLPLAEQPIIYITDSNGNAVDVAISVFASAHSSTGDLVALLGNTRLYVTKGFATFTNLAIASASSGYFLSFAALETCCGNQLNVTSNPFNITKGKPYKVAEASAPQGGKGSEPFHQQPVVLVLDAGNNIVEDDWSTLVTAEIEQDPSLEVLTFNKFTGSGSTVASMAHFNVGGIDYIMVASNYDERENSYNVKSVLYMWEQSEEVLVEVQSINTDGATFCKHVQSSGKDYILIANGYKETKIVGYEMSGTYLTESYLYEFRNGRLQFIESFQTKSPTNIESFMVDNRTFVVVSNSFDGNNAASESDVYLFTPNAPQNTSKLTLTQELRTVDASVLHAVHFRSELFLIVGSRYNTTSFSYAANTEIYRFSQERLEHWQTLTTYGIVRVSSFTIEGEHTFVVVGNSVNKAATANEGFVAVHKLRNGYLQDAAQEIGPIFAMSDLIHFTMNGSEYLVVTENPRVQNASLLIYAWDVSNCSSVQECRPDFLLRERMPIKDAESVVYFRIPSSMNNYTLLEKTDDHHYGSGSGSGSGSGTSDGSGSGSGSGDTTGSGDTSLCVDDPMGYVAAESSKSCDMVDAQGGWWACESLDPDFNGVKNIYVWELCPKSCKKCTTGFHVSDASFNYEESAKYGSDSGLGSTSSTGGEKDLKCEDGQFTGICNSTCNGLTSCSAHGRCHGLAGECICDLGWTGQTCRLRADVSYIVCGGKSGFQFIGFRKTAHLTGTRVAKAEQGMVSFSNLGIDRVNTDYRLRYESTGLLSSTGKPFSIVAGDPWRLSVLIPADHAFGGDVFETQASIGLIDKGGNIVRTRHGQYVGVTLSRYALLDGRTEKEYGANMEHGALKPQFRGNVKAMVQQGVASFTDLGLDLAGLFLLQYHCLLCDQTVGDVKQEIMVRVGPAHKLVLVQPSALSFAGLAFGIQPTLELVDAGGNSVVRKKEEEDVSDFRPIQVAACISDEKEVMLSTLTLSRAITRVMMSSPTSDVEFATVKGESLLLMAVNEHEFAVYSWGCQGPTVLQTVNTGSAVAFEFIRIQMSLWAIVVGSENAGSGALSFFAMNAETGTFVLHHRISIEGLSISTMKTPVKSMLLGNEPYVLTSESVWNEMGSSFVSISRLYHFALRNESNSTRLVRVQEMSFGEIIDAEHFHFNYEDYLVIQNASHIILNVWNSTARYFQIDESVPFSCKDIEVICCAKSGFPLILIASLDSPSIVAELVGAERIKVSLDNLVSYGMEQYIRADAVRHIFRGRTLYVCFTSYKEVAVYRAERSWLGETQMKRLSLPTNFSQESRRDHRATTFFEANGEIFLLLTGRDEDIVVLQMDGRGILSGSTIVLSAQGTVEFTDLSLDRVGSYKLFFTAVSLDMQHESYDTYIASGVEMNVSVALGRASGLALRGDAIKGLHPAVSIVDHGGNFLTAADKNLTIMMTRDMANEFRNLRLLSQHQMSYPGHVHHFAVDATHYIAIANSFDGVSYTTDSLIMKMVDEDLIVWQAILTRCAYRFSSFKVISHNISRIPACESHNCEQHGQLDNDQVDGQARFAMTSTHFLAVANHFEEDNRSTNSLYSNGNTFFTMSVIYRFNPNTEQFETFQELPTVGATKIEAFSMEGIQYLAVANFFDGTYHSVNSQIWKWDIKVDKFTWMQDILTVGAHDIAYISTDGRHFLLVAQYRSADEVEYGSTSMVLQYVANTESFELLTTFASAGARDLEVFIINGVSYFAVTNYARSYREFGQATQSFVYSLECSDGISPNDVRRVEFSVNLQQSFNSTGGSSWTHFERAGIHFVALTTLEDKSDCAVSIYVWNGARFDFYTATACGQKVIASDFFTADGLFYGVVSMPLEFSVSLFRFESDTGAVQERFGPVSVKEGQAVYKDLDYSLQEACYFYTKPEGLLQPVSTGPVSEDQDLDVHP